MPSAPSPRPHAGDSGRRDPITLVERIRTWPTGAEDLEVLTALVHTAVYREGDSGSSTTQTGPKPAGEAAADVDAAFDVLVGGGGAFERREWQVEYARHVLGVLGSGRGAVEAGAGTGKTYGYLVAGLEHARETGRRLVVSTSTTALRDQAREAVGSLLAFERYDGLRAATLHGRASYLCPAAAAQAVAGGHGDLVAAAVAGVEDGVAGTRSDPEAPRLTCNGRCPGSCPADRARRRAVRADVVVTTHASLALLGHPGTRSGDPSLRSGLVDADWRGGAAVVVDEAHLFSGALRDATTSAVSLREIQGLLSDVERRCGDGNIPGNLTELERALRLRVRDLDDMADPRDLYPARFDSLALVYEFVGVLVALGDGLSRLYEALGDTEETGEREDGEAAAGLCDRVVDLRRRADRLERRVRWIVGGATEDAPSGYRSDAWIHLVWREEGGLTVARAPFELGALPGGPLPDFPAVVFTSATLPDGPSGPAGEDLGRPVRLAGAYDLGEAVRAAVVRGLPAYTYDAWRVEAEERYGAIAQAVRDVADPLGGRTLVLFASRAEMAEVRNVLGEQTLCGVRVVSQKDPDYLERFGDGRGRVLLGVATMWTGVDLPDLAAVVVPRLPFASPESPLMYQFKAKSRGLKAEDPSAGGLSGMFADGVAFKMRQALGRLVRSAGGRGVFVCLDERLASGKYAGVSEATHPHVVGVDRSDLAAWVAGAAADLGLGGG